MKRAAALALLAAAPLTPYLPPAAYGDAVEVAGDRVGWDDECATGKNCRTFHDAGVSIKAKEHLG